VKANSIINKDMIKKKIENILISSSTNNIISNKNFITRPLSGFSLNSNKKIKKYFLLKKVFYHKIALKFVESFKKKFFFNKNKFKYQSRI